MTAWKVRIAFDSPALLLLLQAEKAPTRPGAQLLQSTIHDAIDDAVLDVSLGGDGPVRDSRDVFAAPKSPPQPKN